MQVRRIPDIAIDFIRREEGVRLSKYLDVAGKPTIGIGHLIRIGEVFPDQITIDVSENLLRKDLLSSAASIIRLVRVLITDHQYASLLSWIFNLGGGALQRSTLRSRLNREDYIGAADEFPKWCFAGGVKVRGLYYRRLREKALFLS